MYEKCYIVYTQLYIIEPKEENMTYQVKKSIVSLVSVIIIFGSFCLYMYPQFPSDGLESVQTFRFWGAFVFSLILVSVIAHIIINIVFNIMYRITTGEKEPTFEDEARSLGGLKKKSCVWLCVKIIHDDVTQELEHPSPSLKL